MSAHSKNTIPFYTGHPYHANTAYIATVSIS